ncbi:MAG TPA: hypothetical protein VGE21_09595, partial [Flavobacteriales bacterium]
MATLHTVLLVLHIIAGFTALLSGTVILVLRKGGLWHRRLGRVFFGAMIGVGVTAFGLSIIRPNAFLFMVGVFSLYQALGGFRAVRNRTLRPAVGDWMITVIGAANGAAMLVSGQVVLIVFGGLSVWLAFNDIRTYLLVLKQRPVPRLLWLQRHIGFMMGAYIATFTAFLVVNLASSYGILVWLGPTVVGVPLIVVWTRKHVRGPSVRMAAGVLVGALAIPVMAQPYVEGGDTRHRFAQLTLGLDAQHYAGGTIERGRVDRDPRVLEAMPSTSELRLVIGGTHFWGHVHFDLAFPLVRSGHEGMRTGAETGMKVFPWRIRNKFLRPWLGLAWVPVKYSQGEGPLLIEHRLPLSVGALYARRNDLLHAGLSYDTRSPTRYPAVDGTSMAIRTPPFWFSIGWVRMFDTTLGAEPGWISGRTRSLTDTLAALGRLDGPTVSIGVSASFLLGGSSPEAAPSSRLTEHRLSKVFPEFAAGYYFHRPDLQVEAVYRTINDRTAGYSDRHTIQRRSLALEAYKFISDMHGFAAFVGAVGSHERVVITDVRNGS